MGLWLKHLSSCCESCNNSSNSNNRMLRRQARPDNRRNKLQISD